MKLYFVYSSDNNFELSSSLEAQRVAQHKETAMGVGREGHPRPGGRVHPTHPHYITVIIQLYKKLFERNVY